MWMVIEKLNVELDELAQPIPSSGCQRLVKLQRREAYLAPSFECWQPNSKILALERAPGSHNFTVDGIIVVQAIQEGELT